MGDMDGQPEEGQADEWSVAHGSAAGSRTGDPAEAILYSATLRFQMWVSPAGYTHGFSARIIGGRLLSAREFSDRETFVQFIERLTDVQPGLR